MLNIILSGADSINFGHYKIGQLDSMFFDSRKFQKLFNDLDLLNAIE